MELILVRHGQPAWSVDGIASNDPYLTPLGRAQAASVGARMAEIAAEPDRGPLDRLVVSPAVRAAETAAPIAEALDLVPETHDWLLELRNPPEWEGAPIEDVDEAFSGFRAKSREEWWDGLPGGESFRDFHQRITAGIDGLLAAVGVTPTGTESGLWDVPVDAPAHLVAVAHGGTNSMIIAHLLDVEPQPWEWERFVMGHASVAVLATVPVAGAHIWSLQALGDANHIAFDDRTR